MYTIYKYELEVTDKQVFEMPYGAKPLSVDTQNGHPCMWVQVNTNTKMFKYEVVIVGTGHPLPNMMNLKYVGTFKMYNDKLIYHVYFQPV